MDGLTRRIEWPENAFYHAHLAGADRDAILLLGIEPNPRWRAFSELIVGLAQEHGVELMVSVCSARSSPTSRTRATPR